MNTKNFIPKLNLPPGQGSSSMILPTCADSLNIVLEIDNCWCNLKWKIRRSNWLFFHFLLNQDENCYYLRSSKLAYKILQYSQLTKRQHSSTLDLALNKILNEIYYPSCDFYSVFFGQLQSCFIWRSNFSWNWRVAVFEVNHAGIACSYFLGYWVLHSNLYYLVFTFLNYFQVMLKR